MRLRIKTIEFAANKTIIDGVAEIGNLKGVWKSDLLPVVNREYFAELTITGYYEKISKNDEYSGMKVNSDNGIVHFDGYCEDIDEEVYYIRLDTDWLEMIDVENDTKIEKGDFVSFSAKYDDILVFPYELR